MNARILKGRNECRPQSLARIACFARAAIAVWYLLLLSPSAVAEEAPPGVRQERHGPFFRGEFDLGLSVVPMADVTKIVGLGLAYSPSLSVGTRIHGGLDVGLFVGLNTSTLGGTVDYEGHSPEASPDEVWDGGREVDMLVIGLPFIWNLDDLGVSLEATPVYFEAGSDYAWFSAKDAAGFGLRARAGKHWWLSQATALGLSLHGSYYSPVVKCPAWFACPSDVNGAVLFGLSVELIVRPWRMTSAD